MMLYHKKEKCEVKLNCCPEQYHLGSISIFVHKVALGCRVSKVNWVSRQVLSPSVELCGPFFFFLISMSNVPLEVFG